MKSFIAIFLMAISASLIIPFQAKAEIPAPKEIIWDNSTIPKSLPNDFVVQNDEILIIKPGTNLNSPVPTSITVNGLIKVESSFQPSIFTNINFILNTELQEKSLFSSIDMNGSILIQNGNFDIIKSRIQNPVGIDIDIQKSTDFLISKNEISNSDIGISISPAASGILEYNTIENNGLGLVADNNSSVVIQYNNIFDNKKPRLDPLNQSNFGLQASNYQAETPLLVQNNWWGCSDGANSAAIDCEKTEGVISLQPVSTAQNYKIESHDFFITEFYPNPKIEYLEEWIEVYNSLPVSIPSDQIKIYFKDDLLVLPKQNLLPLEYMVITSSQNDFGKVFNIDSTKILDLARKIGKYGMSNSGGEAVIYDKNNLLLDKLEYGSYVPSSDPLNKCTGESTELYSCSRFADDFEWTSSPTPGDENKKTPVVPIIPPVNPPVNIVSTTITSTQICPSTVKIIEASKFINCRVTIIGKVIRPSGSTFYLNDGTGEIKIYLQSAKHITKPRLYTGNKLQVTGILDNYLTGLRLLPQVNDDIKLLKSTATASDLKSAKTKSSKLTQAKKSSSSAAIAAQTTTPSIKSLTEALDTATKIDVPKAEARVKGIQDTISTPAPHTALKILLICATMLLIALSSYNLGVKNGNNQPTS